MTLVSKKKGLEGDSYNDTSQNPLHFHYSSELEKRRWTFQQWLNAAKPIQGSMYGLYLNLLKGIVLFSSPTWYTSSDEKAKVAKQLQPLVFEKKEDSCWRGNSESSTSKHTPCTFYLNNTAAVEEFNHWCPPIGFFGYNCLQTTAPNI